MKLLQGDDLVDYADKIKTKKEFDYFLECFVAECANSHPNWQNTTLIDFLVGLENFSHQMGNVFHHDDEVVDTEVATWRLFAQMLGAATVYE